MKTSRMTQASRRQLDACDGVQVVFNPGSGSYIVQLLVRHADKLLTTQVFSSSGPMEYPTHSAAIRAIRRIRPDFTLDQIPVFHEGDSLSPLRSVSPSEPPSCLPELRAAQDVAHDLARSLERLAGVEGHPPGSPLRAEACRARSLLSRLYLLETASQAGPGARS